MRYSYTHVGIAGPIGSGKTYLATKLAKELPRTVVISFATALKDICSVQLKYRESEWYREVMGRYMLYMHPNPGAMAERTVAAFYQFPHDGIKNRTLLQHVGTDVVRADDPDFWVKCVRMLAVQADAEYVISDDVRFTNEALAVKPLIEIRGSYDHPHAADRGTWRTEAVPHHALYPGFGEAAIKRLSLDIISQRTHTPGG